MKVESKLIAVKKGTFTTRLRPCPKCDCPWQSEGGKKASVGKKFSVKTVVKDNQWPLIITPRPFS